MIKKLINNIDFKNVFYYLFIIVFILFSIKNLGIEFNNIIYIIIIVFSIYLYNIYDLENKQEIIDNNKEIDINISPIEYSNLFNIINNLREISSYNLYVYNEILKYIKLFYNTSNNKYKIQLKTEILNNLDSLILTLPIHLDSNLQIIIKEMKIELDKYIEIDDNINSINTYNLLYMNNNY